MFVENETVVRADGKPPWIAMVAVEMLSAVLLDEPETRTEGTVTGTVTTADAGEVGMIVTNVELPETTVTGRPASGATVPGESVRVLMELGAAAIDVEIVVEGPITTTPNWLAEGPETNEARPDEVANDRTGKVEAGVEIATVVVRIEFGAETTITWLVPAAPAGTVVLPKGASETVVPVGVAVGALGEPGESVKTTGATVVLRKIDGTGVVTASVGLVAGTA
jgi:hypothetical protein